MDITSRDESGVMVMSIGGRLDAEHAELLKNEFRKLLSPGTRMVMDLEKLDYLDSTGLGALVFCLKNCNERGGKLKLASLGEKPRMIFEITRAYRIFDIYDDLGQAIAAFN